MASHRLRVIERASIALLVLAWACRGAPPSAVSDFPALDPEQRPGVHTMELELEGGGVLRFAISVPEPAAEKVPLVLALHYGGEVTPGYGKAYMETLVLPAFRELGAIVVAPDCPGEGWTDPKSEAAVLALLDHVAGKWPVDAARVAVTGYSLGGGGTWHLVARHAARFSAALPVAGWPAAEVDGSVPIYAVHGRRDEVVPLGPTEQAITALQARGASAELVVVDGPSHYETGRFVEPLRGAVPWLKRIWATK